MIAPDPPPLPTVPTKALPGSPEKVMVLAWRAANGYALWHPADANGGPLPLPIEPPPLRSRRGAYDPLRRLTLRLRRIPPKRSAAPVPV